MRTWLESAMRRAAGGCGLAGCMFLAACVTPSDESSWMDHGALMLHPSRHEMGVAFSFGGSEEPREQHAAGTASGAGSRIAAAVAPETMDDRLPGGESFDFKSGRLYIHTPKKRHDSTTDWGRRTTSSPER
jgi:hypothetical protein